MDLSKNELLEKLDTISSRYGEVVAIKEKMNSFVPEDIYIRQVELPAFPEAEGGEVDTAKFMNNVDHKDDSGSGFIRAYERTYAVPKPPKEPKEPKFEEPKKPIGLLLLYVAAALAALTAVMQVGNFVLEIFTFSLDWGDLFTLVFAVLAAIVAGGLFIGSLFMKISYRKKVNRARVAFDLEQKPMKDEYNEKLSQYEYDMQMYRQKEQDYIDAYWAWRTIYLEHLDEEERVKAQLEIDRQEAVKQIEENELVPAKARLDEVNDLLSEKYLPAVDKIIELIKNGRADTLKEAINLYEEILYKEKQLELEKEKEQRKEYIQMLQLLAEQRRYEREMEIRRMQELEREMEEERRRNEEERRHREQMEFLEKQEANRQAEARRAEARRQHEETAAMYRDYHATHRQCQSCANMTHCRMAFQRSNCASYVPK